MTPLVLLPWLAMVGSAGEPWIVGGAPVLPGEWPQVAALLAGGDFVCTGVLVAPQTVLTAGHCDASIDEVVLDTLDWQAGGEHIAVVGRVDHPEAWTTYDLAVLRLERAAAVPPASLVRDCEAEALAQVGRGGVVVGFGSVETSGRGANTVLHAAAVPLVDVSCAPERGCNPAVAPGGELIAGGEGVDSCVGDSGGPLFLADGGLPFLLGITSRSALPATRTCGDGGIYARPHRVGAWLQEAAGEPVAGADCPANHPPRVEPASLRLLPLQVGGVQLVASDAELDQWLSYSLSAVPPGWEAAVGSDGYLVVLPAAGAHGDFVVGVHVEDSGDPPLSVEAEVRVRVLGEVRVGTSCSSTGCRSWWTLWLALGLASRRRR